MAIRKGLDGCFLQYGIRQEDMRIVERVCEQDDVDAEWLKENILKAYQSKKNDKVPMTDSNEVIKLLKQALKKIK
jgi:hypothetical protein